MSWESETEYVDEEWEFAIEEAIDETRPLLKSLASLKLPIPTQGFELENDKGAVTAEGEICWHDKKLVVLLKDQAEYQPIFSEQEFETLILDDNYEAVLSALKDRL